MSDSFFSFETDNLVIYYAASKAVSQPAALTRAVAARLAVRPTVGNEFASRNIYTRGGAPNLVAAFGRRTATGVAGSRVSTAARRPSSNTPKEATP